MHHSFSMEKKLWIRAWVLEGYMEMKERGGKLAPASHADGSEHKDEDGTTYTDQKTPKQNSKQHLAHEAVELFISRFCKKLFLMHSPEEMFGVNIEHVLLHRMGPDRLKCGVDQCGHKCGVKKKTVMITRQQELWLILNTSPVLSCQPASSAILKHFASKMSKHT